MAATGNPAVPVRLKLCLDRGLVDHRPDLADLAVMKFVEHVLAERDLPAVDGEPLGADSPGTPLRRVQIAGAPQGEPVTVEATVEGAAALELVETTYDPTIAGGWVEPGEDVSLMQPRVQIVVEV